MSTFLKNSSIDFEKAVNTFNHIKPQLKNSYFELDIFFSRIVSFLSPNSLSISVHKHSFYELFIPLSGTAKYCINNKVIECSPDNIYILAPSSPHNLIEYSDDYMAFTLGFSFVFPAKLSLMSSQEELYYEISASSFIFDSILQSISLAYEEKTDYYNRINSILSNALFEIFENIKTFKNELIATTSPSKVSIVSDDSRIRLAIQYITDNISSSISVSDVANYVCISSRQLNRILKNALDLTTNDLINELKIKAAKRYMSKPNLSLSQISVMCGFNSLTHFNLTFKKLTGYNPKAFRSSEL